MWIVYPFHGNDLMSLVEWMEYSELRHNNQESSRDSSEDQESSGNFIPYSVTQCKNI